jgi:Ca2+/Na+ antiporter
MLFQFFVLIGLAVAIVAAVRFFVITGVELVCRRFAFSSKTKGQLIGYTTSLPEFVVILSSALGGVFDVGLWNIVSSNIINWLLFLAAVFWLSTG